MESVKRIHGRRSYVQRHQDNPSSPYSSTKEAAVSNIVYTCKADCILSPTISKQLANVYRTGYKMLGSRTAGQYLFRHIPHFVDMRVAMSFRNYYIRKVNHVIENTRIATPQKPGSNILG